MPFTFSHPAIVLPARLLPHRWFSLTGLVVGSMVPDFEYFLRMKVQSNYSHTIGGLFWFDLPLGLLIAFVFHNVVRNELFDNLPFLLKSRLIRFKQFNWNRYFKSHWGIVIISLLVGAASHLFWDSFTHANGYFVQSIAVLKTQIHFSGRDVFAWKILQHASTLFGAIVISITFLKLPADKTVCDNKHVKYWSLLTTLTIFISAIRFLTTGPNVNLYGELLVTLIAAGMISLILTPLILKSKVQIKHPG